MTPERTWQEAIAALQSDMLALQDTVREQHQDAVRVPTLLQQATMSLKELLQVDYCGQIGKVDAVMQEKFEAAHAATAKLEAGFDRRIEDSSGRLADLKDRVTALEGNRSGGATNMAMVVGIGGFAAAAITLLIHFTTGSATAPGPGQVQADNAAAMRALIDKLNASK